MSSNLRRAAFLMALLWLAAAAHAKDPVFKPAIVTASWTYERPRGSINIAGVTAGTNTITTSSVTIALDGMLITGEWVPKNPEDPDAQSFRSGTDVPASVNSTRMLLQLPDGGVVSAKITYREKQKKAPSSNR